MRMMQLEMARMDQYHRSDGLTSSSNERKGTLVRISKYDLLVYKHGLQTLLLEIQGWFQTRARHRVCLNVCSTTGPFI
jgi:hypothetical protein